MSQAENFRFYPRQDRPVAPPEVDRARLELLAATLVRKVEAEAQLRERLVEFWLDHFAVSMPAAGNKSGLAHRLRPAHPRPGPGQFPRPAGGDGDRPGDALFPQQPELPRRRAERELRARTAGAAYPRPPGLFRRRPHHPGRAARCRGPARPAMSMPMSGKRRGP